MKRIYFGPSIYDIMVFSILGFVSGLPFALVTTTLQAWLTQSALSVTSIGLFGLVSIPYALKPCWAVLIDWLRVRCRLGLHRIYFITVVLLGIALYCISLQTELLRIRLAILMLSASFLSSIIDICVDAMRIILVKEKLQGLVTSWFVIFYRCAFILSGGLGLIIASRLGWHNLYFLMSCLFLMAGFLGYVLLIFVYGSETEQAKNTDQSSIEFFKVVYHWLKHSHSGIIQTLSFLFVYKFHGNFLTSLVQVFLIEHVHLSLEFIGFTYKTVGMLATFFGGLLGGVISRYFSIRHGIFLTTGLQSLATLLFLGIASELFPPHELIVTLCMYMESFCIGLSTTVVTVLITKNCDAKLAATQYAFFTAAIAWERTLVGPLAGYVQAALGWSGYFAFSMAMFPVLGVMLFKKHPHFVLGTKYS